MSLLSVVVPCYREADNLPSLHGAIIDATSSAGLAWELILVDDGSPDATGAVAEQIADQDPRVRAIALSRNFGKESALLAGLRVARGDRVLLMDADLQHPTALIPAMVEAMGPGIDQVIARRSRAGEPWLRKVASQGYYRLMNRISDVPLADGEGDFRLLSRRAVDALLGLGEVTRFSKGLFSWIGFSTVSLDYENVPRVGGASSWSLRGLANYGIDGAISFTNKPLRLATWAGLWMILLTVLYLVWLIWQVVVQGIEVPGYVTLVALITGMGGAQLLFLGILGEYIGRIFVEVKGRPHYVVKSDSARTPDARDQ